MDVVAVAQRVADEVLFPAALATDVAGAVPVELLDTLADAGLYGLGAPGGPEADFVAVCGAVEALASGCLATTFVWAQHLGAVRAAAFSANEAVGTWLEPLARGEHRAGLAPGGALPGPPQLVARPAADGWVFDGCSPFVSGWGRIDVVHTAARTEDGRLVWALLDARESDTLAAERLRLVALDATSTVRAEFRGHPVPEERVTSVDAYAPGAAPPELLRFHAAFPLGVAGRCCRLLGPTELDAEVEDCRAALDRLDQATIEADRGAAAELALRCAAALLVTTGSRSLLLTEHSQRLAREALFALVYALRPGSREELLARLGAL